MLTPRPHCQVRLIEKILELETCIQTLVEDSKNVRNVDTALDATSSGSPVHCSVPDEPVQQGKWVTAGPEWGPFSAWECNAQDQPTTNPHPTPSHRGGIWINDRSVS